MTNDELLGLIGRYEKSALGSSVSIGSSVGGNVHPSSQGMTTLEVDRYNALNAYYGRPMGNEVDGRSQVVLSELRDTVEWIMPQLMRIFAATPTIVQFDPEGEQDEQQADIETRVINHLFMSRCNGFFVLHDMIKDALLLRNGYARVYWDDTKKTTEESYTGLTEIELTELLEGNSGSEKPDKVEVLESNEYQTAIDGPQIGAPPTPLTVFDVKIKRTVTGGEIKVECLPPEEMLVSSRARSGFDEVPFVEHKTTLTRSKLIEMGYAKDLVEAVTQGKCDWDNLIAIARNDVTDELSEEEPDKSEQPIDYRDVYIRVDWDDDGVSELRHVCVAGTKVLDNEVVDEIPLSYCSPIRMPHRHVGISFYDLLYDLQVIKTTLFRQGLDNLYLQNNQRTGINWRNVNIQDLLSSRPGGMVRVDGAPAENIMPLSSGVNVMGQVIPALEYVDSVREMRTGIGKDTMGVDADALQDVTKGGQLASMSAAAMKVELVARLLAEGVKDLFRKIHSMLIHNQNQPMSVAIAGKWMQVDPSSWRERTRVSVNVGLGSGTREESRANLVLLMNLQKELGSAFGLVGPKEGYETFKRGVHLLGFENPEQFAMDPNSPEYQQHMQQMQSQQQSNPAVQVAQIRAHSAEQIAQGKEQQEVIKLRGQLAKSQAEVTSAEMDSQRSHHADMQNIQSQMAQTLLKVIGQIVASQLSKQPGVDAGQVVSHDFNEAEGSL